VTQAEMSDALVRQGVRVRQTQTAPSKGRFPPWFRVDADCHRCSGRMTVQLRRTWTDKGEGRASAKCARCGWGME